MEILNAIIFGIIQGVTEFLPVSSSGHLVILHELLNVPMIDELIFDVYLHVATLMAVVVYFRNDISRLFLGFFDNFHKERKATNPYAKLSLLLIVSTIPAALIGYFFESKIEEYFRSVETVVVMLVLVGVMFIITEKRATKTNTIEDINLKTALTIGVAQSLALIPGTSRSGITIVAGLANNLKREEAIRFSFLMSIPIIAGAAVTKVSFVSGVNIPPESLRVLGVACFSSFVSGLLAIKFFIQLASRYTLVHFAYYRFALAAALILIGIL